jgi:acetaldehyde dehydrogenase
MVKALSLDVPVSAEGINYIIDHPDCCDIVFDATSAKSHCEHAPILKKLNKRVIDMTPAKIGLMSVPSVNLADCLSEFNVNMITCGGQASIPVAYAIGQTQSDVDYIEVVSSIASRSAGPATRQNLDEYIKTTAEPCVDMQTTIFAKVSNPNIPKLTERLSVLVKDVQKYVPGYEVILGPIFDNGRIVVMVRVRGLGDYLPAYAGNLDIINCAAIAMAEEYACVTLENESKGH